MARTDFSDYQRAEIFVLDRATCSYSGRSLWISDYGIDPLYEIDWADHLIPASHGGKSVVENGAAASWLYNYLRGNNRSVPMLFHRGRPTEDHVFHLGVIDRSVRDRLVRFERLHPSDWFLNRAMWHIWVAICSEHERRKGFRRSRVFAYYAGAALKALTKWRRLVESESVSSLEKRHLLARDAPPDVLRLLEVRQVTSTPPLIRMMRELFPLFDSAANAMYALSAADTPGAIDRVMGRIERNAVMPQRIRARLLNYAVTLSRLAGRACRP